MKTKLLLFGITGDLSKRKLLPALQHVMNADEGRELTVIGVSRRELDVRQLLDDALGDHDLSDRFRGITMDVDSSADYERLKNELMLGDDEQLLLYLSVPPSATMAMVEQLGKAKLNAPNIKLLLEKPFGTDLASARAMLEGVARYFSEEQVYRTDHYLAKTMAQNIVSVRADNPMLAKKWNNNSIEKIEIIASEDIGIEGRGDFYEQTGALRDFLQGHLLQLLALTLMDVDSSGGQPERRAEALRCVRPADPSEALRAQYDAYRGETGNEASTTETFVQLELMSDAERWRGVPFTLATGKALDKKVSEVRIYFKTDGNTPDLLIVRMQQPEKIEYHLPLTIRDEASALSEAYERVFTAALRSERTLFVSSEEVVESWKIVQPVLDAWRQDTAPLATYSKGSSRESAVKAVNRA